MHRFDRRLEHLARQFGCGEHGKPLICASCNPSEPMPKWLKAGLDTLMDGLLARMSPHDLRIAFSRGFCRNFHARPFFEV